MQCLFFISYFSQKSFHHRLEYVEYLFCFSKKNLALKIQSVFEMEIYWLHDKSLVVAKSYISINFCLINLKKIFFPYFPTWNITANTLYFITKILEENTCELHNMPEWKAINLKNHKIPATFQMKQKHNSLCRAYAL